MRGIESTDVISFRAQMQCRVWEYPGRGCGRMNALLPTILMEALDCRD